MNPVHAARARLQAGWESPRFGASLASVALHSVVLGLAALLAVDSEPIAGHAAFALSLRAESGPLLVSVRPDDAPEPLARVSVAEEPPALAETVMATPDFPALDEAHPVPAADPPAAWMPPVPASERIPRSEAAATPPAAEEGGTVAGGDGRPPVGQVRGGAASGAERGPGGPAHPAQPDRPAVRSRSGDGPPLADARTHSPQRVAPRPRPGECDPPRYPRVCRERGEEGTVLLRVTVDPEGQVLEVTVRNSSGHRRLDEAAVDAISGWLFEPAREDGRPIGGVIDVPVGFRLK